MSSPLAQPGPPARRSPRARRPGPARGSGPALTQRTLSDRVSRQHQIEVATIAGGVTSIVATTALGGDPTAISTWFFGAVDSMISRIQAGYAVNRNSAMSYLTRHASLNGVRVDPVPGSLDTAKLRSRLHITGPVAFKTAIAGGADTDTALRSMASQMSGVADEYVRNGDRDVITQSAMRGRGVVGWRRRLSGRACGFCSMLASRGAVYVDRQRAGVTHRGGAYHPHCHCWAEPLYSHQQEPPEVQLLQRQWQRVTAGKSGSDAQRAWRRHWEQKATPEARVRFSIPEPGRPTGIPAQQIQVRPELMRAQTPADVGRVLEDEYQRITGRTLDADFAGSVRTAREHAEGLLQAVERHPDIRIDSVRTGTTVRPSAYAHADRDRFEIVFSERYSSLANRESYLGKLAEDEAHGFHPRGTGNPAGIAQHEVAHLWDPELDAIDRRIDAFLFEESRRTGVPLERMVRQDISGYATRTHREMVAEAFADVTSNGAGASALSRRIVALVEEGRGGARIVGGPLQTAPRPATVAQLRARVAEAGITVPTGLRTPALRQLVDDLDSGLPASAARERAVRSILAEREAIAGALREAAEMAANQGSARALQALGAQIRRRLDVDAAKVARPLLDALNVGDLARVQAALGTVARSAKLRPVGEAGAVLRLDAARMSRLGPGGADDVVRVVRPGFETTFERQTVTVLRADVLGATPEQAARLAPVKAAKAAPRKAAAERTVEARRAQLADAVAQIDSRAVRRRLEGGTDADTFEVKLPDGRRVIEKVYKGADAQAKASAEELGSLVSEAVGLRSPLVLRADGGRIYTEFLEDARFVDGRAAVPEAVLQSDDGLRMGLMDAITRNWDRAGNWGRLPDGRLFSFDTAFAFGNRAKAGIDSPFGQLFMRQGPEPVLAHNPVSPTAMAQIRARLEALRPDFARAGRLRAYQDMMRTFDQIEAVASGPRLVPTAAKTAVKKATPAKKVAAPKLPPAPEKLSLPALKTELQRAGVDVPTMAPRATVNAELVKLRAGGAAKDTTAALRAADLQQRTAVADTIGDLLTGDVAAARKRLAALATGDPARPIVERLIAATPARLRTAVTSAQRKVGLEQVGVDAGKLAKYDPKVMSSTAKIPAGADVVVVRPGYAIDIGGERVVLSRPVVELHPAAQFDEILGRARVGTEALEAAPIGMRAAVVRPDVMRGLIEAFPDPKQWQAVGEALVAYRGVLFKYVNQFLRGTLRGSGPVSNGHSVSEVAALMRRAFQRSKLREPVVVWRGLRSGRSIFGPRSSWPDDLTGVEWTSQGFLSTSTSEATARKFATEGGEGVLLRFVMPDGTPAIQLSGQVYESELLFPDGLRFRVVRDRKGRGAVSRILDVELVPG